MQRIVIKVGTHVLSEESKIHLGRISSLVELISEISAKGVGVILVSSGAVAAGYSKLALDRSVVSNRQALAAIGQPLLLSIYQDFFQKHEMICSQVLLGANVFDSDVQIRHAKNAIDALLSNGVIPIINENDTVSIDELVFGDNDRLSAHVAHYFDADMLVLLSDIDGYYDKDPNVYKDATLRTVVGEISAEELSVEHSPNNEFATGGIVTKLQAAEFLMKHKREMFLASGFDLNDARSMLIDGAHEGGTLFRSKHNL